MKPILPLVASAMLASTSSLASAQTLPSTIRVIVPNAAGSWADAAGRVVLKKMGDILGDSFVTVNSSVALGTVGLNECAGAKPDGQILCQANYGHMVALTASSMAEGDRRPYDLWQRLMPVGEIAETQYVLMTDENVPAGNLDEFIAYARKVPDKLNFATHGPSSVLIARILESVLGVQFQEVPYGEGGEPQAMNDLLAGRVQVKVGAISTVLPYRDKLHVLGTFGGVGRSSFFPEVPSMLELGYSGFSIIASWTGLWAPLGTPKGTVDALNAALVEALRDPDVSKRLQYLGMEPRPGAPAQLEELRKPVLPLAEFMREHGLSLLPK